jgi:DNA-binding SARP family transcriptional activator
MARKGRDASAPTVRISLSGRTAITRGGTERELPGRQPRALFALLAAERHRAVARGELAEALWGDRLPATWQSSLRVAISKVRAFLVASGFEPGALMRGAGGYRLRLGDSVEVDVERARRDVEAAERALASGQAGLAGELAASARAVLTAPLVPGAEGPWIDDRRRAARGLLVRALETEAEARLSSGEGAAGAAATAEEAVALEPFQESAHRAVMRAHAAAGNKAEALRCYERCRQVLADELGVDPSPATQALYLLLLRDEPIPEVASAKPQPVVPERAGGLVRVEAGRQALSARRWEEAFDLLTRADAEGSLGPEDLEGLGEAALWTGHHQESVSVRQRAHHAYLEARDQRAAARVALALASNHGIRQQPALAEGWFRTAARLLQGEPEGPDHGFLAFVAAAVLFELGELDRCLEQAQRVLEAGQRYAIPELQALGIVFQGLVLARQERVTEALPLLDEGMALATTGRLSPLSTGLIYCRTILTWLDLFEYRRAAEWIETVQRRAVETGFGGNPGDCQAHLAAALLARGSWAEAERDAELACDACEAFELSHVGLASYTLGEIHLRRGDLRRAAEAFRRANEHGVGAQPGVALLELASGNVSEAFASVKAWLDGTSSQLVRARALPAAVEIALAAGHAQRARSLAEELSSIAVAYGSTALTAAAARALGAVQLSEGETVASVRGLRDAVELYRRAEIPYELARARALLADALLADGDRLGAVMELEAARTLFTRLGARPDAGATEGRLHELESASASRPGRQAPPFY